MPLRDLAIFLAILGTVPFIFQNPYWGVLVWNWLAFMNPHKYVWGFGRSFRFSLVIATTTLLSLLLYQGSKRVPWRAPVVLMAALFFWVSLTTLFAFNSSGATEEWDRFWKIVLMVFVALALVDTRQKLDWFIWVLVLSLGFYGFKGGLFTIAHGGRYSVGGPPGTFIGGNNEIAFALVTILPLMRYLQLSVRDRRIRWGLGVLMGLCGFSIVGSYSRGAFLAGATMGIALWLRTRRKLVLAVGLLLVIPLMLSVMPEKWFERMDTISTYHVDDSALGRINAWKFAWALALDHPVLGGGARAFTRELFARYAPEPERVHDAHSIYFEMLAEQGFVGLGIFLALGLATFLGAGRLMRLGRLSDSVHWAYDLGAMCQVSLVGYAVGGAFLGLAYFDLPYTIMAFVVLGQVIAERELASEASATTGPSSHAPPGALPGQRRGGMVP
jgi:probable O-glycosylation ligase (exosortase A-associated)